MKKWKKVLIVVLIVFIASVGAVAVWQRNNLTAIIKTMTNTDEEIAQQLNETKQKLEGDLKEKYPSIVSDFSAEDEKKIMKGEMSVDDAVEKLNREYQSNRLQFDIKSSGNPEIDEKADEIIGDKVIELYSLKAYYLGQLGQLEATVKKEYAALPESKRNLIGKKELVSRHIGPANGLLSQCDSRVSSLLGELQGELKKIGADTSIIKTIKDAYENEKALKKAYYLKLMND